MKPKKLVLKGDVKSWCHFGCWSRGWKARAIKSMTLCRPMSNSWRTGALQEKNQFWNRLKKVTRKVVVAK